MSQPDGRALRTVRPWLAPVLWAGTIFWLSSRPTGGGTPGPLVIYAANGVHVVLFFVLAALVYRAADAPEPRRALGAAAIAIGYGILDELHQAFVPGRDCSIWDIGSDACGAIFAVAWCVHQSAPSRRARTIAVVAVVSAPFVVAAATWLPG